jgi:hypothetical protein
MKLEDIISLARKFAATRSKLAHLVDHIRRGQQRIVDNNRAKLKSLVNATNTSQALLATAIAEHPELFEKPRTVVVDGVRIGLTTGKSGYDIPNEETTIALIKRHLGTGFLHVRESISREALDAMDDDQLKRIGVHRKPVDPNVIVIKPTDSAVDKLVKALLEDPKESATADLPA